MEVFLSHHLTLVPWGMRRLFWQIRTRKQGKCTLQWKHGPLYIRACFYTGSYETMKDYCLQLSKLLPASPLLLFVFNTWELWVPPLGLPRSPWSTFSWTKSACRLWGAQILFPETPSCAQVSNVGNKSLTHSVLWQVWWHCQAVVSYFHALTGAQPGVHIKLPSQGFQQTNE